MRPRETANAQRAHPWHGAPIGEHAPAKIWVYVEIVPTDTVKYELDKDTGLLKIDRPQKFSSVCPALYGFVPRTLAEVESGRLASERSGRPDLVGDHDPLDVCVFTEKEIPRGDVLLQAVPIGGIRLIDRNEADDKIVAVLADDPAYSAWTDLAHVPAALVDRLRHYFLTYKQPPDAVAPVCEIAGIYGREEAHEVIEAARRDYRAVFG